MKYQFLLFDADNTILDFDKAEQQALKLAFDKYNLPFDENVLQIYIQNNLALWKMFEQGKISKEQVLIKRFSNTFAQLGWQNVPVEDVASLYEQYLKLGFFEVEHAREVLEYFQDKCKLYLVSNGVAEIQRSRLAGSDMEKYFCRRFVSEDVGFPKPQIEYFNYCFQHIDNFDRSKALIVGDSLSSDIQGGINAQIDTCWFNFHKVQNTSNLQPDYTITDLRQLYDIVCRK